MKITDTYFQSEGVELNAIAHKLDSTTVLTKGAFLKLVWTTVEPLFLRQDQGGHLWDILNEILLITMEIYALILLAD
jgi:hypothetical protein